MIAHRQKGKALYRKKKEERKKKTFLEKIWRFVETRRQPGLEKGEFRAYLWNALYIRTPIEILEVSSENPIRINNY